MIGGGPGGLCSALLLKSQHPDWDVTVFEQHPAEASFGYGVGLRWSALTRLAEVAPGCARDVEAVAHRLTRQILRRDDETVGVTNHHGLGISRSALLLTLARHAAAAGVRVHTGRRVSLMEVASADLVVAADGVGSETRTALAERLGVSATSGELAYLWCGAELALDAMTLAISRTPSGPLVAHVMPYGPGSCTFQVDARTGVLSRWRIKLLENEFAGLLAGTPLRTKQASWSTFTTIRCENWSAGNVVFVGDAVHTAHYTVGSGTALAIEDAVALAGALRGAGSVADAFAGYQAARKPYADRLQRRADRSERWWSTLDVRCDLPLPRLVLSYLTRTGAVTLADLAEIDGALLAGCLPSATSDGAGHSGLAERILAAPYRHNGSSAPSRWYRPDGRDGTAPTVAVAGPAGLDTAVRLVERGATQVRIVGPDDRDALLDRLEFAEQLRARTGVTTIVRGPVGAVDDLALGVLCDRTDLVEIG